MLVTRLPVLDREQDLVGISTVIYEAYEEDIFCASRAGLHCWHVYESTSTPGCRISSQSCHVYILVYYSFCGPMILRRSLLKTLEHESCHNR